MNMMNIGLCFKLEVSLILRKLVNVCVLYLY